MNSVVKLYSTVNGEISRFLKSFGINNEMKDDLLWEKEYENPLEMADIITALIENQEDYKINIWISLDKDMLINVTKNNADDIIRYLFERYPY